jgi:hypothetical protein
MGIQRYSVTGALTCEWKLQEKFPQEEGSYGSYVGTRPFPRTLLSTFS